jgi:hypothetical protein
LSTKPKRSSRSSRPSKPKPRRRKPPAPKKAVDPVEQAVDAEVAALALAPPVELVEHEPEVSLAAPEPGFAARVSPPVPRPHPDSRRAIFFDVENTSRAEHIARVIDYLAVNRLAARTDFMAVGNWRVIGHDTARLLAQHGAQLVHSAPSVGVRDWSDLRIAVAAGVWMAAARAGDVVELVSDDRAFDAVGDVAVSLGIEFRRLSFRRLAGMRATEGIAEMVVPESPRPSESRGGGGGQGGHRRGRRGGRGRSRSGGPAPLRQAPPLPPVSAVARAAEVIAEPAVDPQTAPHDEMVSVIEELIGRSSDNSVSIDTLANELKSRGFRRPPGSPRLITRLRRIRQITIDRAGRITLVGDADAGPRPPDSPPETPPELHEEPAEPNWNRAVPPVDEPDDEPMPGNVREPGSAGPPAEDASQDSTPRRRRSRRGGRGRRRGRSAAPAAP